MYARRALSDEHRVGVAFSEGPELLPFYENLAKWPLLPLYAHILSPYGGNGASPAPMPRGSRQDPATVARICELGRARVSVPEIDNTLHLEGHSTSTGTPWPARNDGCVVVRTLLKSDIPAISGGNDKIARFISKVAATLGGNGA